MARYQKLSDELIVPNLDQDISFFYDPATKKLRKRFEIYPEALDATVKFAHELERTHTDCSNKSKPNDSEIINTPRHHVILSEAKNLRSFLDRCSWSKSEMFRFAQHDTSFKDEV